MSYLHFNYNITINMYFIKINHRKNSLIFLVFLTNDGVCYCFNQLFLQPMTVAHVIGDTVINFIDVLF